LNVRFCSVAETQSFAKDLAKKIPLGKVVALKGDLGTGKTTFTQGFAKGLSIHDRVGSPSFKIVSEYVGTPYNLYHVDCYRLKDSVEFLNLGGENLLMPHDGVSLIEWADVIQPLLPENTIEIKFSRLKNQPNVRMINIKGI
tara:strand:+ start:458 stop:883 length:426 start_codon:yes stop_codon:yes gene_type:complete